MAIQDLVDTICTAWARSGLNIEIGGINAVLESGLYPYQDQLTNGLFNTLGYAAEKILGIKDIEDFDKNPEKYKGRQGNVRVLFSENNPHHYYAMCISFNGRQVHLQDGMGLKRLEDAEKAMQDIEGYLHIVDDDKNEFYYFFPKKAHDEADTDYMTKKTVELKITRLKK